MTTKGQGRSADKSPPNKTLAEPVRCPNPDCGSESPIGQKYCGQCGQPLDPSVEQLVEWAVSRQIDAILKDKKVVEVETAQAVLDRLLAWSKLYAAVLGIPLLILAVTLAMWGLGSSEDFRKKVKEANENLASASKKTQNDLKEEGDAFMARLKKDQAQLESLEKSLLPVGRQLADLTKRVAEYQDAATKQIEGLDKKVTKIETGSIGTIIRPSAEDSAKIEKVRTPFRLYLRTLGLKGTEETDLPPPVRPVVMLMSRPARP